MAGDVMLREEDMPVDASTIESLVGYRLRRASHAMMTDFADAVQDIGLRPAQFSVLTTISANPGVGQTALGRVLGIQRANMVPLLNGLTEDGLIRREPSIHDRRAFDLYLTPKGEAMEQAMRVKVAQHEDRMLSVFSAAERSELLRLLSKIAAEDIV